MSVLPREQLSSAVNNDEFRNKRLLQIAVTEAIALLNGGKGQEAVSQIVQYADIAAQSCVGCYVFGLIHFNAGKLRDALSWLNRALALQPAFVDALSARARSSAPWSAAGGSQILRSSPQTAARALTNRGALLERFGRLDEALACFDAIEALTPGDSANLVLQKLGRHKEALAAYEEAARRGPPDAVEGMFSKD